MSDLLAYNPNRVCPKCHAASCGTLYLAHQDQLERTCLRCGFKWRERSLGAKSDAFEDWAEAARLLSEAGQGLARLAPEDWSKAAGQLAKRLASTKVVVDFSSILGREDRDGR